MTDQALSGLRVIDLGGPAAGIAGRWLAAFGADVLHVEPPTGDWSRRYNPLGDEADARGRGALQRYLDAGKRSTALDLGSKADRQRLRALAADADLLLHCSAPDERHALGLDDDGARSLNPRLVEVWMPAFPPEGPYAGYAAAPIVLLALGGYQFLTGQPGREPLALPGFQPDYLAGMYGIVAAIAGLVAREGRSGDSFRISQLETLASAHQFTTTMWTQQGIIRSRHGNRWENLHPNTMLRCRDGWLSMAITTQEQWERLATMMGRPDLITDERFDTHPHRHANADLLDEIMVEWMMQFDKRELFERGQEEWRLPVGPLLDLQEILDEPQYRMRSFFVRPEGSDSRVLQPGLPVYMSRSEWRVRRSPDLGEGGDKPWTAGPRFELPSAARGVDAQHSLAGVRILDFTRVWSGPLAARVLADLGAEVIKVEAPLPEGYFARNQTAPAGAGPRRFMRAGNYQKLNRNRLGVCIDLRSESGRDIVRRLARKADMLIENFSARVMPNFGLGYDELSKENPGLVMLSMPGFGAKGPYQDYIAYGPAIEPMTGLSVLLGYPGEEPRTSAIAYPDAVAALNAAAAAMVALAEQRRTGLGQHIDLSQTEASVDFLGEYLVAYQETGSQPPRIGNRHPHWAPQGTYRCIGDDEWVSIAVRSDAEWQSLCAVAGLDGLVKEARFATAAGRRAATDEIDRAIAHWTEHLTKQEVMELLQGAGVPAGAVLNGRELVEDPQLAADGFFIEVQREGESYPMPGTPVVANGRRRDDWLAAPAPGEHNRLVLSTLLGLSDAEIDALDAEGVLGPTLRPETPG